MSTPKLKPPTRKPVAKPTAADLAEDRAASRNAGPAKRTVQVIGHLRGLPKPPVKATSRKAAPKGSAKPVTASPKFLRTLSRLGV
jgi:hypothetical protein